MSWYKEQSAKVAHYYDRWNAHYKEIYGSNIQAHRPADDDALMNYIIDSADIQNGQRILDAGCGNCGPAIYIAGKFDVHIEGLTISNAQVEEAQKNIDRNGMQHKINVRLGDYHELDKHYMQDSFDRILFLESLGHAGDPARVVDKAYSILKPGGEIYIKDFYSKVSTHKAIRDKIERVVGNLNRHYSYNVMDLSYIITALRNANFEVKFIKQLEFVNDASAKNNFEEKFGINLFEGMEEFYFAEWLEIKCFKPF